MLARGTPLWVVSELLGHASLAMTKDVYGHLVGDEKREVTEAIPDVLFDVSDRDKGKPGEQEGRRRSGR
jgi:integrase